MKTSTFNRISLVSSILLGWAILFIIICTVTTSLHYDGHYKLKTDRERQQQQDRIEQKINLILKKQLCN